MSILIDESYSNPNTPLWLSSQAQSNPYHSCVIANDGGNTYGVDINANTTIGYAYASTSGFVDGYSYLCVLGLRITAYSTANSLISYSLVYTDSDNKTYEGGCSYYLDTVISQYYENGVNISLPFIYKQGSDILLYIRNSGTDTVGTTISFNSCCIIETNQKPTSVSDYFIVK